MYALVVEPLSPPKVEEYVRHLDADDKGGLNVEEFVTLVAEKIVIAPSIVMESRRFSSFQLYFMARGLCFDP